MIQTEQFTINRRAPWAFKGAITVEISCDPLAAIPIKLGLAVKASYAGGNRDFDGAVLSYAVLSYAVLSNADLSNADLRSAVLSYAVLSNADLSNAVLRPIMADFWLILTQARREVPALIAALRNGEVDGSTYTGACKCLVGTLEGSGATGLPHEPNRPAEAWFSPIKKGDTPDKDTEGGFRAKVALEWALEFCALSDIAIVAPVKAKRAKKVPA